MYPNLDFWLEKKPSGNPGHHVVIEKGNWIPLENSTVAVNYTGYVRVLSYIY
jgi:hypothetical protein